MSADDAAELPEGWAYSTLGELGSWVGGGTPSKSNDSYWKGGTIPWVSAKDMKADFLKSSIDSITEGGLKGGKLKLLPVGSVLMVVRGMILARAFPVAVATSPLTINQDLRALVPSGAVDPSFLLRALQWASSEVLQATGEATHGTRRLDSDYLKALPIPLPPLAEQRRIVSAIDKAFASVSSARERLVQALTTIKRFRLAVLESGCSGGLTEDWRGACETDGELPSGWRRDTLRNISDIRGGIQKQPKRLPKDNAYPYLRVANVLRGRLDLSEVHRMELFGGELETYRLAPLDLLIVEGNGSLSEIGRSALWNGDVSNCVHQNHIIRVRVTKANPRYVDYYWNSPLGRECASDGAVTSAGLHSLSVRKIAEMTVPLPPFDEQLEIVNRISSLHSHADNLEGRVRSALVAVHGPDGVRGSHPPSAACGHSN